MAAILSAVFLLLIMLFLAPLATYLPLPAMAGILFVVAWGLVDRKQIVEIMHASRAETAVLLATFVATLTLHLEYAIYIGVLLSLILYLNRTSRPPLEDVKPADPQHILGFSTDTGLPDCPQLKIVRLNGSIYFGAVDLGAGRSGRTALRGAHARQCAAPGVSACGHRPDGAPLRRPAHPHDGHPALKRRSRRPPW